MAFVLDASIALSWVMPDEQTDRTDALFDTLREETAFAPPIWSLETGNALCNALRRGRITETVVWRLAGELLAMPIEIVPAGRAESLKRPLQVAIQCQISIYDATYLELAQRRQLPLATLDLRLRKACSELNVPVLPAHV